MDIYALNNWDAVIYAYGVNLINLLFGSPVWKSLVVIMSVYAAIRFIPEVKDSPNIVGKLVTRLAAIFVFSALTLWPVSWTVNIYTITKAETYTNVFKWILPVDRDDEFTADLYLSAEAQVPVVIGLAGEALGLFQFWTMWLVDKAGRTLGTDTIGKGLMFTAKLTTLQRQISQGLDGIVADLQEEGSWTPEDRQKYAQLNDALKTFFASNCVSPQTIEQAWEESVEGGSIKSIDYFLDHIDPNLSHDRQQKCRELGETVKATLSDFCSRWSSSTGDPPEVCSSVVEVSLWKKVKNFFNPAVEGVKELPDKALNLVLSTLKDFLVGFFLATAGIVNFIFLAGITSIIPLSLGVINLIIFFLSPLFFLTQLVQGNFIASTVRIILEMLWARLLYAVFVLAYVIVCILQGPAWKALGGAFGLSGTFLTNPVVIEKLAAKMKAVALKGMGIGLLSGLFSYTALTLAAGMLVLWFGAQLLRTIIFGEYLHITQVLSSGKDYVVRRARFKEGQS